MPDKPDKPIIINIDKAVGVHIGDTYITQPNAESKPSVEPKPKPKYIINQINPPKPEEP